MSISMRPLSAGSYEKLLQLNCPMLVSPAADHTQMLQAASLWHYIHTADIDLIDASTQEEILAAVKRHAYHIDPADYPAIFQQMTRDIKRMHDAFVEAELPAGSASPLASTTATSQTSLSR